MTSRFQRLADFTRSDIRRALASGLLEMELGPFNMQLKGQHAVLIDFLFDAYRDAPVRTSIGEVADVSIHVRAPNIFRRFIRPQVIPDPGFIVPAVPLPQRLSPLALEMGLNLAIALKICRFVTFHSAVVANDKGAIMVNAKSGGGKSTLASALMQTGYRLLSDEFGLLNMADASLMPYPRPVSLKEKSIDIVRDMVGDDWLTPKMTGTPKGDIAYYRARPSDIAAAHTPALCKLMLFPRFSEGATAQARALPKSETMMRLIPSSTNYHLLGAGSFKALADMVAGAEAYEIIYGNTEDSLKLVSSLATGAGL